MQNTESTAKSSAPEMPRKILFIVNPNAGKRISEKIIQIIQKKFPKDISFQIAIWKDKDHFDEITHQLLNEKYSDAIAVGGDGTVNHVAKTVLNTGITLGIVPIGSGNGLARSLGLSMRIEEVMLQIAEGKTASIDCGTVNGIPFFCTSGIGFDAHIGNLFASSEKRGLSSYVKITVSELLKYRAKNYSLLFNGKTIQRKAFLITVANAGQYGNDFYIAPKASMQDGLFHVAILKPFNVLQLPGLLWRILGRKADLAHSIETLITDQLIVERNQEDCIHFDGEPIMAGTRLEYRNQRGALKVIIGPGFKAV